MFKANEFRAQLARKGMSQRRLADVIGIDEKTMITKVKTGKFNREEIEKIMDVLDIDDPRPIFFAKEETGDEAQ